MAKVMTNVEFINKAIEIALAYKTVYASGMYGHVVTQAAVNARAAQYPNWYYKENRHEITNKAHLEKYIGRGCFGFDCVCLIKAILWGWKGDLTLEQGGAKIGANGVPDQTETTMIEDNCKGVSTDFSTILPGEFLFYKNKENGTHCGIYIGGGLAVECTNKAPLDGVGITAVENIGSVPGYPKKPWTSHGKLDYVDYVSETVNGKLMKVNKHSYCSGEPIYVTIGNQAVKNAKSWVGLYRDGVENFKDNSLGMWGWFNDNALLKANWMDLDKNLPYPLTSGKYKVVMFQDDGYTKVDEVRINIQSARICEAKYDGTWVDLSVSGYLAEGAWIGIYPKSQTVFNKSNPALKWQYIPRGRLNQLNCQERYFTRLRIPFSKGAASGYKAVLFSDSGYYMASQHSLDPVTIHTDYVTASISPDIFPKKVEINRVTHCGADIDVTFYGVTSDKAWVGLYPYRADHNYSTCSTGMWCYTATGQQCPFTGSHDPDTKIPLNGKVRLYAYVMDVNTGTMRYLKPGKYQVVLFDGAGYTPAAVSDTITIEKPTITDLHLSFDKGEYSFRYNNAPCYDSWIGIYKSAVTDYADTPSVTWSRVGDNIGNYSSSGTYTLKYRHFLPQEHKAVLFFNSSDDTKNGETYREIASCKFLVSWDN